MGEGIIYFVRDGCGNLFVFLHRSLHKTQLVYTSLGAQVTTVTSATITAVVAVTDLHQTIAVRLLTNLSPCNNPMQVVHTHMPQSRSSITVSS